MAGPGTLRYFRGSTLMGSPNKRTCSSLTLTQISPHGETSHIP